MDQKSLFFDRLSENLSGIRVDQEPKLYACPLCLACFRKTEIQGLTWEHVPQKSLGGCKLVLTCKSCNDRAGHQYEHHLSTYIDYLSFFNGGLKKDLYAKVNVNDIGTWSVNVINSKEKIKINGIRNKSHPDVIKNTISVFDESVSNGANDLKIKIRFTKAVDFKNVRLSYIKSAYLMAFYLCGYEYIFRSGLYTFRSFLAGEYADIPENCIFEYDKDDTSCGVLWPNDIKIKFIIVKVRDKIVLLQKGGFHEYFKSLKRIGNSEIEVTGDYIGLCI